MLTKIQDFFESISERFNLYLLSRMDTYAEELNAKADRLGDDPRHTLAYYEKEEDPLSSLSNGDLQKIEKWMRKSEGLPLEVENPLSVSDQRDIDYWMGCSFNLPLEMEPMPSLEERLESLWNSWCYHRLEKKLERYEAELKPKHRN